MYWVTANIQLVTILAALKQIENALFNSNVIKMIKNKNTTLSKQFQNPVWVFMVLNTTQILFQLYRRCQFYWWRKSEYQEKTTDLSQVTDKPEKS